MAQQLVDRSLSDEYPPEETLRCIQIGLLCVHEDPAERSSMDLLAVMLSGQCFSIPAPSMPEFLQRLQVIVPHSSEIDLPRSGYSDWRGTLLASDILSSSSGSIRLLSPTSPLQ
ncbi:G-type lectin S-receptor-like serine/threonine-protein kinase [Platanthera guangdongensis]|uniref:G-type lectin S-receptor-like serine/threonine-protein kinase n=1 Tax=Platanthera guangdongensis TaxID=2320717 RepID=A0ABR2LIF6_9ASPA